MKEFFTINDFLITRDSAGFSGTDECVLAALKANAKLSKLINEAPVVYSEAPLGKTITTSWTEYSKGMYIPPNHGWTHSARLICIEPIVKKECEHEPNANRDEGRFGIIVSYPFLCCKCGKKLKATWSVVDE